MSIQTSAFNRTVCQLVAASGAAIACASADGSILSWNNAAGGSAGLASNWNPAQIPVAADVLNYNLGATYSVTFPASVSATAQQNFNQGNVTLTATSPHTDTQQLVVGLATNSNSTVNITSGSFTVGNGAGGIVAIGGGNSSTGVLNVSSSSARLTVNGSGNLRVGNVASGSLNVTGAGVVEAIGPAAIQIGSAAGSQGTVLVNGTAGLAVSALTALSPTTGDLTVGVSGSGLLTVNNGGRVILGRTASIAPNTGSGGTVNVGGGSANGSLEAGADLHVAHNSTAAAAGTGTVNLLASSPASGQVSIDGTTFVGDSNGGHGTLNISGGQFETRNLIIDPVNGTLSHTGGELSITSGGSFVAASGLPYLLPVAPATRPAILRVNGAGATATLAGGFQVGDAPIGNGHLIVSGGAVVTTTPGGLGQDRHTVAGEATGTGAITVTGAGSRLNLQAVSAALIGNRGSGALTVSNGAVLSSFQAIQAAVQAGSSASVSVSGGSTLSTAVGLTLGGTTVAGGVCNAAVSGSSNVRFAAMILHPSSSLLIDDSTFTAEQTSILNAADLRGTVTMSNGAEIDAEAILVSGSVLGGGNLYGNVTIQPGGRIVADSGDFFIGSLSNSTDGFVNQGILQVDGHQVHILDGNASPAGDISMVGGHLFGAGLTFGTGDTLTGTGGISAPVTASGAIFTAVGGQLVFNSPVSADETCIWAADSATDQFMFAAGGDFTGRGNIAARVATEEEAAITATGTLTMGNHSTNQAILLNGPLHIGAHSVVLASNTTALLGVLTTIDGGTLDGPADNTRTVTINNPFGNDLQFTVHDAVAIEVPVGGIVQGTGTISHKLRTEFNSSVNLTGPMSIRGSSFFNSLQIPVPSGIRFVRWDGLANVGPHTLTFTSDDHRFDGPVTLGGGTIAAPTLAILGSLTGHGTLIAEDLTDASILNGGVFKPGGPGIGSFTVVGAFINRFRASSSIVSSFIPGTVEVDISGDQGFAHDELYITQGDAELFGTLTVRILDAEPPPGQVYTILRCENGNVTGTFEQVNLPPLASGSLRVRYTANTVEVVAVPACLADFNNDGELNPDDLADFIGAFFSQPPATGSDFNADGETNPDDLADFIGAFFSGCG